MVSIAQYYSWNNGILNLIDLFVFSSVKIFCTFAPVQFGYTYN